MNININKIGQALYGENWRAPLARDLNINERTMRRCADGEIEVNPKLIPELINLIDQNIQSLTECKIMLTTPTTQLKPIKALVFVSAWAETVDKIIKVGDDVALPVDSTEAQGHYEIKDFEPSDTLKKLAGMGEFSIVFGCGFDFMCKTAQGKILGASSTLINDLVQKIQEEINYSESYKNEQKLLREIEQLKKCYRFNNDDKHYLSLMFDKEIRAAMR